MGWGRALGQCVRAGGGGDDRRNAVRRPLRSHQVHSTSNHVVFIRNTNRLFRARAVHLPRFCTSRSLPASNSPAHMCRSVLCGPLTRSASFFSLMLHGGHPILEAVRRTDVHDRVSQPGQSLKRLQHRRGRCHRNQGPLEKHKLTGVFIQHTTALASKVPGCGAR